MPDEPVYRYSWPGLHIDVWPNRVEVVKGTLLKKRETILTRSITGVTVTATKRVRVETPGGRHEWAVGLSAESCATRSSRR